MFSHNQRVKILHHEWPHSSNLTNWDQISMASNTPKFLASRRTSGGPSQVWIFLRQLHTLIPSIWGVSRNGVIPQNLKGKIMRNQGTAWGSIFLDKPMLIPSFHMFLHNWLTILALSCRETHFPCCLRSALLVHNRRPLSADACMQTMHMTCGKL